jgi:hypothetical protein
MFLSTAAFSVWRHWRLDQPCSGCGADLLAAGLLFLELVLVLVHMLMHALTLILLMLSKSITMRKKK